MTDVFTSASAIYFLNAVQTAIPSSTVSCVSTPSASCHSISNCFTTNMSGCNSIASLCSPHSSCSSISDASAESFCFSDPPFCEATDATEPGNSRRSTVVARKVSVIRAPSAGVLTCRDPQPQHSDYSPDDSYPSSSASAVLDISLLARRFPQKPNLRLITADCSTESNKLACYDNANSGCVTAGHQPVFSLQSPVSTCSSICTAELVGEHMFSSEGPHYAFPFGSRNIDQSMPAGSKMASATALSSATTASSSTNSLVHCDSATSLNSDSAYASNSAVSTTSIVSLTYSLPLSSGSSNTMRKGRSENTGQEDYFLNRKSQACRDETWEAQNLRHTTGFTAHLAAKHLTTEQFMTKHGFKTKLAKYQGYMDRAFAMIQTGSDAIALQGVDMLAKVMARAWSDPKFGHDLAYDLCEYIRETGYFVYLLKEYIDEDNEDMELAAGAALEECFSFSNREMVVNSTFLQSILRHFDTVTSGEVMRISLSILESLFKHSVDACSKVIDLGGLDHVLKACKTCTNPRTMRHAALALSNLAMFGGTENHPQLITRNVPEWLFLLASLPDEITRYYACLAICMLVSNPEIEAAVVKSGTLGLVEPFLLAHRPEEFAKSDDYKHQQGRPKEWLEKLLPLLTSKRREARSLGAFHFLMEAHIKKLQDRLEVFQEIGSIPLIKELASSPDEIPAKYATLALETIGETVPYKLCEDVPLWTTEDVKFWVNKIGFADFAESFERNGVDGDLLLLMTEDELRDDIGMRSSLQRKRFVRELKALKIGCDYQCVDDSRLDKFMMSISPDFSVYTYRMLEAGVSRHTIPRLTDEMLKNDCRIKNGIHRMKILEALQDVQHIDDMEVAVLRKHVDVFISYRRSTGSQLASLLRVLLQLRGYKVFIDVDRLYAGQFDSSLLMNIKAAKHFVLVLTPQSLDRCIGDDNCNDWIHKEVKCALESNTDIIPILSPNFVWPQEQSLPEDMRTILRFNSIIWIHEYQEACVDKIEKFIKSEINLRQQNASLHQVRSQKTGLCLGHSTNLSSSSLSSQGAVPSPDMVPSNFGILSTVPESDSCPAANKIATAKKSAES